MTTQEAGNLGISDDRQLEYASGSGLVILTHNRHDFELLADAYFKAARPHAGMIIAVRRLPHDILRRLLSLLNETTADELANNVWYL